MRLRTTPLAFVALAALSFAPALAQGQSIQSLNLGETSAAAAPAPATVLLTWETDTFVPQWYLGRALPIPGSTIRIRMTALDESGRTFNTEGQKIRWHANYLQHLASQDKPEMTYTVPEYFSGELLIKMGLFAGGKNTANARLSIPVVRPRLVISLPYPNKTLPQEDAAMQALPYFFPPAAVNDLVYSWTVKGTAIPRQNLFGGFATLSFDGPGEMLPVSVLATSKGSGTTEASAQTFFSVR